MRFQDAAKICIGDKVTVRSTGQSFSVQDVRISVPRRSDGAAGRRTLEMLREDGTWFPHTYIETGV